MSSAPRIQEQVHGILSKAGVEFTVSADGSRFQIPCGTTCCAVEVRQWDESVVAEVKAFVLENIDATAERRLKILERLNQLNRDGMFGTAYLLDGKDSAAVILEHQLLGEAMDGCELMDVLAAARARAERLDGELMAEFESGERWGDVEARRQDEGDVGVTVEA